MLTQAALVNGTNLFQKNYGVFAQPYTAPGNVNMRRQFGLAGLAGNSGGNHCRRMAVSCIILNNQHRTCAALLAAHYRGQVRIEDIAPFNG